MEPMVEINSHAPSTVVAVEAVGNDDEGDWSRDDDAVAVTEPMQSETETITPAAQGMIILAFFDKLFCFLRNCVVYFSNWDLLELYP